MSPSQAKIPQRWNRQGMTLVEMMVALAIFSIVIGVVFSFMVNSRRSYSDVSERVRYQQAVRAAISLMTREIRSAGCNPASAAFDRFGVAHHRRLRVRMDLDGDGTIETTEPAENVLYRFRPAPDWLTRDNGSGEVTILRNVRDFTFSYFDGAGNQLLPTPLTAANIEQIRYVQVDFTGESDRGEDVDYRTRILIRND